jgi:hypothetical protein
MSEQPVRLWPAGAGTGVGSLPGTDAVETARLVFGELPDLPHLPELPDRGAGADMVGRSAALLADLHVDLQPSGWRLVPGGAGAGIDERRAAAFLDRDLDALEEVAGAFEGSLKLQVAGPWTLAAEIEMPRGGAALGDDGAARDIAEALAEGAAAHVAAVRRRVPAARLLVQLDEPALPAVLAGRVPTPSGFDVLPAVEESIALERLGAVIDVLAHAGAQVGAHCCAAQPPVGMLRRAGATFLSFDATLPVDLDALGEAVEADFGLIFGVVPTGAGPARGAAPAGDAAPEAGDRVDTPTSGPVLSDPSHTVDPIRRMWRRLGFAAERLGEVGAVSPTCGLAGASPAHVRTALRTAREAGRLLVEEPE